MTVEVKVESQALATAANNALAFIPANSPVKVVRIVISADRVEFTATDTYAAGRDYAPCEGGPLSPLTMLIGRDALVGFDSTGRKDGDGIGTLRASYGDGVTFYPMNSDYTHAKKTVALVPEAHLCLTMDHPDSLTMFEAIDDMIADREDGDVLTAFQPGLLQRFSKVKADKSERVADLAIADPEAPVLVKIGPTFKGLIMPVTRNVHAQNIGEEGLW